MAVRRLTALLSARYGRHVQRRDSAPMPGLRAHSHSTVVAYPFRVEFFSHSSLDVCGAMHYDMYMESAATKGKTMSKQSTTDGFYERRDAAIRHARETRLTYEQRAWLDTHLVNAYPDGDGMRYQRSNGYGGKSAQLRCVDGKWLLIEELYFSEYTQCTTREMPNLRAGLLAMVEYLATL